MTPEKSQRSRRLLLLITNNYRESGLTMQVQDIINQKDPIGYRNKTLTPIGNREKTSSVIVDQLLADNKDLIDPNYQKWFAARFYYLPFDQIHRAASEARQDGKHSQKLFSFLIRKLASQLQPQ